MTDASTEKSYILFSKDGFRIEGQLDTLTATAVIEQVRLNQKGQIDDIDWNGYTEVDWNSQKPAHKAGVRCFIDERGNVLRESEVFAVEESRDDEVIRKLDAGEGTIADYGTPLVPTRL